MATLLSCSHGVFSAEAASGENGTGSAKPVVKDDFPRRPEPIIELGNEFLGTGTLSPGFETITGAIWQPSLLVFGTYRSALQTQDNGTSTTTEWANRLDLFANLYLTSTERFLIGMRPLDEKGVYSGYRFHPNERKTDGFNDNITTFFFEGDFGELFPNLDVWDREGYDVGFAIGRQPISFQEGIMINDTFDAFGITQNSLRPAGTSNLRITGLYGWNEVNRSNNVEDNSTDVYGLFTEIDFPKTTVAIDLAYVDDDDTGDAYFVGLSAVQRIGLVNTAFRLLTSHAERESATTGTGTLLFAETSWTPEHSDDLVYINGFAAFDQYSSVARGPEVGGPLGRTGILFASPQIGTAGAALSNQANEVVGGAIGYQTFLGPMYGTRKQLIVEAGFRQDTNNVDQAAVAIGARYQQAFGQHYIMQVDGYAADYENTGSGYGLRAELVIKF
jgi:hypothetical protein